MCNSCHYMLYSLKSKVLRLTAMPTMVPGMALSSSTMWTVLEMKTTCSIAAAPKLVATIVATTKMPVCTVQVC